MPLARVLAGLTALVLFAPSSPAQSGNGTGVVSLTTFGTAVTENFDTLATTGTANSTLPTGWYFREVGSNASNRYRAGDGSSPTGDTYSFGATGSTDRAFGTLQDAAITSVSIGVAFQNTTGAVIGSVSITYTGEQWRLGNTGRNDRLDFAYQVSATGPPSAPNGFTILADGTYTDFDALDFTSPVTAGTAGTALDGNAAGNFTTLTATITGLNLADGQYLFLRWDDFNASGADDGLGIDNFSLTAQPVPEPAAVLAVAAGGLAVGAAVRHRLRRRL